MRQHILPVPPCAEPGADPLKATGKNLRWGVVAPGTIARRVTADLALLEDSVLHAVSSRSEANATGFAADFGFATSYFDTKGVSGYQQLFNDPDVDVVYVATPHSQHREVAEAALAAGKHVLCEKPFTVNAAEARALAEVAAANGVFLMEAVWTRFLPSINRAWDIIASGELGEVQWVQADLGFVSAYDRNSRLWDPAAGGGALLDLAVYPLTWALGALGVPTGVAAQATLTDDGVDMRNALTLAYANGANAQLITSIVAACPGTATVSGNAGWLTASTPQCNPSDLTITTTDGRSRVESFGQVGSNYVYQLREVTRCIQDGLTESPTMPWADSVATMELLDDVRGQVGIRYGSDQITV
ncbi:oxidoreductase [Arthrobacter sp. Soil782]|uniref:Gfo/Idh/MocA family protein n=1 Tax=Arthrobacter sp. Soil782 TaxID=1736410 RepID=UPI0006F92705|nr:Gfo/Idh/MocA family oxidoreductase [Arthrobacter sp. Soil782]KRF08845.1 oxidoreductase [Arthrobacter sp. Soil782]